MTPCPILRQLGERQRVPHGIGNLGEGEGDTWSPKNFIETVGVSKRENVIDVALLEFKIREDLNKSANRVMAVLDPVKVVITNYPEGKE